MAVFDCLGMCLFAGMPAAEPTVFGPIGYMLKGVYGGECSVERLINQRGGILPEEDNVPAFMRTKGHLFFTEKKDVSCLRTICVC